MDLKRCLKKYSVAEFGFETICVDKDKERIALLNKGKCPFYEPELENLLKKHINKTKLLTLSLSISEAI